ncbi:DUF4440 domain-containing protein [Nocardiopsis gilva YIM 90087]|uniref:DUF4440 domain-containing protein n=1 Tax=Nocardiopsis gilva YIM 90087 TaxID=1235441 RepID=A0A223S9K6_9ACTN|nr:SgcJ/EcaC family oxidoreductase [Nocardiopsis gilva]ASU84772.1 DUF4440 domain-containing protein [Nocardiopsis gilva YIM 90087]
MDEQIRTLHENLLGSWNARDPAAFAALFTEHGVTVGFDGSVAEGSTAIREHLAEIFGSHQTAAYVAKVREVRPIGRDAALPRAVAGMVPPGGSDLNPGANAVQSLVAVRGDADSWRIELFQNTPAAFHGRPEESERLTAELRDVLRFS